MKRIFPLIILGIIASLFIFYNFTSIPKYLAFDEVEFGKLALSLEGKPYESYSALATGHSTLYFYIILFSFKMFGVNTFALRLPAAIFGILSVIMFYLVARLSSRGAEGDVAISSSRLLRFARNDVFPLILTFIFLTSRWFLNFSRFAFEPTFLLFLELTSTYFLLRSIDTSKYWNLTLSGLFAGLAFNSYTPGRLFFLLPLSFTMLMSLRGVKRRSNLNLRDCFAIARNDLVKPVLFFIIPFIIAVAPLTTYFLTHQDSRIDQLFFWRNHEMTIQQKISGTFQNISSLTSMFFTKGDMNGRHNYPGKPALNPIMAGLFLLGFMVALKNYRKNFNLFFIAYFLISLAPSVPSYPWENPSMLRTFTVLPSVVYFIGQGFIVIARRETTKQSLKLLRLPRSLWSLAMTSVILLSTLYELRTYFKYQAEVFNHSFEIKHPLEKAVKMKDPYEK